ncbi:MAG: hypothetical protein HWE24_21265 [Oceanospirillaceae bacterium]|nr:hypothetical protein [Oceanospirillaceae bacterium]
MKNVETTEPQIPNYVNQMFDNWESILKQMEWDFEDEFGYVKTKSETISCLGLQINLINPKTKKPFSIIISDDLLEGDEITKRLNYGYKVGGDLTKIGEWLDKRKSDNEEITKNLERGKPIQIELLNGVEQNKEFPTSFHIPSEEKKSKIEVGDKVKVVDIQHSERFWVKVEEFISDELMVGVIDNELIGKQPYSLGDKIFLTMDNIIDVHDEDYDLWLKKNNQPESGSIETIKNKNNDKK